MDSVFTALGLKADERDKALLVNPAVMTVLRESGVRERPIWRDSWAGPLRAIELATRRQTYLSIPAMEFASLSEMEIVGRLCQRLMEGSTLEFP